MPKTKLTPVIRKGQFVYAGSKATGKQHEWLCIPLTPASRKAMVDAIQESYRGVQSDAVIDWAIAALAALEAMAKEKPCT